MPYTIGIFDSGLGGLTVMRAIASRLPSERIVYFGDTARVPYGEKSHDTVVRYALESAQFLEKQHVDVIVIACNTASAYAYEVLKESSNIPVVSVVSPGARRAVETTVNGHIAVIGTRGTIASKVYEHEIAALAPHMTVSTAACPLLVPLVEEGFHHHPAARMITSEYLAPLKEADVDTLLLGCTHYPYLKEMIHEVMGDTVTIIDSAECCAEAVEKAVENFITPSQYHSDSPMHRYFVSDDPIKFKTLGEKFLKSPIEFIEQVKIDTYPAFKETILETCQSKL